MPTGSGTNYSTTPNMGLTQPTPGVCGALGVEPPGKSWMELQNSSFSTIDNHTHAPGFGAQVPTAGLNINADLSFGSFNATSLRTARFGAIALGSLIAADVGCLLVSGVDLYYVDTTGTQIRLTSAGGVAGTPGAIGGLVSPAAVTYTPASKLFTFTSSSGFVANMAFGPISIGDATISGGKACTIGVPASLASNYSMTLLASLPGATSVLSISSAGALGVVTYPLVAASIANGTLTTTQLSASAGIIGTQLANNTVTRTQLASVGQQISASSGASVQTTSTTYTNITNLTVTITTTGRPVMLMLIPDGGATDAFIQIAGGSGGGGIAFARGGSQIAQYHLSSGGVQYAGFPMFIDPVAAGTYTYTAQFKATDGVNPTTVGNTKLAAYEL